MPYKKGFSKKRGNKRPFFTNNKRGPKKEYSHQDQFSENEVGILEFINPNEGCSGIIKARYSDFHVNEIDLKGEMAKLTDLSVPAEFEQQNSSTSKCEVISVTVPISHIPQDKWDLIKKMMSDEEGEKPTSVDVDVTNTPKEDRAQIHKCIKGCFGSDIYAQTNAKDDKKIMSFHRSDGKGDKNKDRFYWPDNIPEFVHFVVYKECLDTLETSMKIASRLRMAPGNLLYAGVKDKRAKTTQWFSVRKVDPHKLVKNTSNLYRIKIGNIKFKDHPLKLGMLSGNRFRIALRNVVGKEETIQSSLDCIKDKGFINYYGLQRFGNDKQVPTFAVGVQLIKGNWKEASELILKPRQCEDQALDVTKAKKLFQQTGDAKKALEFFKESTNKCTEYLLLKGLSQGHVNDVVNALEKIPRNIRLLYTHSFQSLIWNHTASKRVQLFGLEPVEGDLIYSESTELRLEETDDDEEEKRPQVRPLTAEEVHNFTIYDIVLPLPGYDVVYPENMKQYYSELLQEHGLSLEMPKQKLQTYNLSGDYRKLMGKPTNFTWRILHYNDPNSNLIRSDLEELNGEPEPEDIPDGKYKSLILDFVLNSSSYATMVLREFLKSDTSTSSNAKLNNYHKEEQTNKIEPEQVFNDRVGLLEDAEKYEAFKNIVFNGEATEKRKMDEAESEENKRAKLE